MHGLIKSRLIINPPLREWVYPSAAWWIFLRKKCSGRLDCFSVLHQTMNGICCWSFWEVGDKGYCARVSMACCLMTSPSLCITVFPKGSNNEIFPCNWHAWRSAWSWREKQFSQCSPVGRWRLVWWQGFVQVQPFIIYFIICEWPCKCVQRIWWLLSWCIWVECCIPFLKQVRCFICTQQMSLFRAQ